MTRTLLTALLAVGLCTMALGEECPHPWQMVPHLRPCVTLQDAYTLRWECSAVYVYRHNIALIMGFNMQNGIDFDDERFTIPCACEYATRYPDYVLFEGENPCGPGVS